MLGEVAVKWVIYPTQSLQKSSIAGLVYRSPNALSQPTAMGCEALWTRVAVRVRRNPLEKEQFHCQRRSRRYQSERIASD